MGMRFQPQNAHPHAENASGAELVPEVAGLVRVVS